MKWRDDQFESFIRNERQNCYWFWFNGHRPRRNMIPEEWISTRAKDQFETIYNILLTKIMITKGKYKGQTKAEFEKNYMRVKDIVDKSDGDLDKAKRLATTQANKIMDEHKALNRAMAAKEMKSLLFSEEIFDVFFKRAYELGSVSKQAYRDYKLEQLGL